MHDVSITAASAAQLVGGVKAPETHGNPARPDPGTWGGMRLIVNGLFGEWADHGQVWTAGFRSVADGERWHGRGGVGWLEQAFPDMSADLYFAIGVMSPSARRRSNAEVVAQPLLIVDDIGTKVDPKLWDDLFAQGCPRPSARIETSPGNETWVWALDGDATDPGRWQDLALIRAWLVEKGLTDDVMDPARYVRLPGGWNSKPKYRGGNGQGEPPRVRLTDWRLDTDGRVNLDALGLAIVGRGSGNTGNWREAPTPKGASARALLTSAQIGAGALARTANMGSPEALIRLADRIGLQPEQVRPGVVEALCPNMSAHTTRVETGFAFLGNGLCHCNHASCQGLATADFRAMMLDRLEEDLAGQRLVGAMAPDEARTAEEWWARECLRDAGGLCDAAEAMAVAETMAEDARERDAQAAAATRTAIVGGGLVPFSSPDPRTIPPRPMLYGTGVIAGFVSVLAAPGGQGKTSVLIADLLAMSCGKNLIGEAPVRPLRVWYHSAEDDGDEAGRRIAAGMKHHGLKDADLDGRLFVTSGRGRGGRRIRLARMGRNGPEEIPGAVDAVVDLATARRVDVIAFDPIAAMHDLPENDNAAMNFLMDLLRKVADRTGVALILTHHSSKSAAQDMDAAGAGAARGASALVDGSRVTRTLVRMTPKEAARFGVPDDQRRALMRIEDAKVNLSPAASARWVRIVGVPLGNGGGLWPRGDFVGVAEAWTAPTAQPGSAADLARVQAALAASPRPPRADQRSPEWVGWMVASVMELDVGGPDLPKEDRSPEQIAALARVRNTVAGWIACGGLVVREDMDPQSRKSRRFVFAGTPAVLADADPSTRDSAEAGEWPEP